MKNETMQHGQHYRITTGACAGCVLRETQYSALGKYVWSIHGLEAVSPNSGCSRITRLCSISLRESYEVLTPEQVMEIELSR